MSLETLELGHGASALKDPPNPEVLTQLQRASFSCGDEICSDCFLMKPPYSDIGNQASEERYIETKAMDQ